LYHNVINTFMIREPRPTVASHYAMNPDLTLDEVGFEYLHTIFEAVHTATGEVPLVIDGDELVANPEGMMRAYCDRVGLPFIGEALHWEPTAAQSVWQRTGRWHQDVDRSTGVTAMTESHAVHPDNDPRLRDLVEHHQPFYDKMYAHRLVVDSSLVATPLP
jgi:Sulfotransferase domain